MQDVTISPAIRILADGRMMTDAAAAYLGIARKTLAIWRCKGKGPRFFRVGGRIFYRKADLDDWVEAGLVSSTAHGRLRSYGDYSARP